MLDFENHGPSRAFTVCNELMSLVHIEWYYFWTVFGKIKKIVNLKLLFFFFFYAVAVPKNTT